MDSRPKLQLKKRKAPRMPSGERGQGGCYYCVIVHNRKRLRGRKLAHGIAMCLAQGKEIGMVRCHKNPQERGGACEIFVAKTALNAQKRDATKYIPVSLRPYRGNRYHSIGSAIELFLAVNQAASEQ
jgi:hypothetical protein